MIDNDYQFQDLPGATFKKSLLSPADISKLSGQSLAGHIKSRLSAVCSTQELCSHLQHVQNATDRVLTYKVFQKLVFKCLHGPDPDI